LATAQFIRQISIYKQTPISTGRWANLMFEKRRRKKRKKRDEKEDG
jgi:hypothetical protein